jgi:pyruvate/2-oxoglutarate dehydrogenase complex dihydrolipoamide dehydrogenase (E3) component
MGLEEAGVEFDTQKGVMVSKQLQTTNKNIYAVGDCCSKYKFTHVADAMARLVIRNALFFGNATFDVLVIPWAVYTSPELAHVGLYPADLIRKKIAYDVYERNFAEVDRAKVEEEVGFVRIYTAHGNDKILGCTIVAPNAGDMISEVTLAITNGIGLASIATTIHPYPTFAESIRQIGDMYNRSRLTPTVRTLFRKLFSTYRHGLYFFDFFFLISF